MNGDDLPIGEDDLQAFVDGRLGGARALKVEAWLTAHPDAAARIAADRSCRDALRENLKTKFEEPIPPRLRVASLRAQGAARRVGALRRIAAGLALFALGAAAGWVSASRPEPPLRAMAREAALAHRAFVVEVAHPVEVPAAQEEHLVRWLSKRLGRPLKAPDLTSHGFRLMGGRLLPGSDGAAAQLMYDDGAGQRLTLFVQAGPPGETAFRFSEAGGAATFAWIDAGFGFAVTAPLTREKLAPIAEAVYRTFEPEAPAVVVH